MILSHAHRFIFLKTNKTGGTSVEIALSRYCGADDVITPISAEDEELRRSLGYPGPQNRIVPFSDYGPRHWLHAVRKGKRLKYYNHMPAREARLLAGEDVWQSYFKFCFERNPWDRVLSLYFWRHPREPRPSLDEFVASKVILNLKDKGSQVYIEGGRVAVDRVCRYEDFPLELEKVAIDLSLPGPLEAPRAKSRFRGDDQDSPLPFSAASVERVRSLFAFEIERFGYVLPQA